MNLTTTITRSKPFYVAAGAGDLAVKTARELPSKLRPSRLVVVKLDRQDVTKAVSTLQSEALALPARAQTVAVSAAVGAADQVDAAYEELLARGRRVVGRIRRQKATQELKRDAGTTVRRTRATATAARSGASETASAAKGTATTAKKSARKATRSTTTAAKRTSTTARKRAATTRQSASTATRSARKTTKTARKAASTGARKVGS